MFRKPCRLNLDVRKPYRTIVSCQCGWVKTVFHRNAWARASLANKARAEHMKKEKVK